MYAKHFLTNSLKNFQLESGLELGFFKVKKKINRDEGHSRTGAKHRRKKQKLADNTKLKTKQDSKVSRENLEKFQF